MEPIDAAYATLRDMIQLGLADLGGPLTTEADARMKVIDPILVKVLGWPLHEVHLENAAGQGFIDYRLTVRGLSRVIVEAKRDRRDFGIADDVAGKPFVLSGAALKQKDLQEGVEQAIGYCAHKNAELACVTNGRQWVVFRANRLADGHDTLGGSAIVFGSLAAVERDFKRFYALLSYESVASFSYREMFADAEGRSVRHTIRPDPVRPQESRRLIPQHSLSTDLDRVMKAFFQDFGRDDAEMRRSCFVVSRESDAAEQRLARVCDELRTRTRPFVTSDAAELSRAIQRVKEMKRQEFFLIVGTKGAGKSTFIVGSQKHSPLGGGVSHKDSPPLS